MLSHVMRFMYFHCTNGFPGHSLDYYETRLGPQRIFQETPVAVFQLPRGTFPHGIALKIPLRSLGWIFESAKLPRRSVPARDSTRGEHIRLIYSGSYCGPGTGRLFFGGVDSKERSSISPARRLRRSLYKFHGSLSNPIFSRYPRILHDTFY